MRNDLDDLDFERGDLVHYRLPPGGWRSKYDISLSIERYLVVSIVGNECLLMKENGERRWHLCQHLEKANVSQK